MQEKKTAALPPGAGVKKRPVTVTREAEGRRRVRSRLAERGCDAREGGGSRCELVRESESDAEQKEKEIDVCVCAGEVRVS